MMNIQLKMKKTHLIKGKSTKIAKNPTTFRKNKPNSPIVQTDVTSCTTMNYTIFASLTKVKNKPNQTQFKPNTNPIASKAKMNINIYYTIGYNNFPRLLVQKTNPKQTQFQKFEFSAILICAKTSRFFKIYPFLIKSCLQIAEKRVTMAFFDLKRLENHKKAVKNQSGKEVKNVLEPI